MKGAHIYTARALYLCVCLTPELNASALHELAELICIVDGAVVHQSNSVVEVHVRVSVLVCLASVCGPSAWSVE